MQVDELLQLNSSGVKSFDRVYLISEKPAATPADGTKAEIATLLDGIIFLIPICFITIWTIVVFLSLDTWLTNRKGTLNVKKYPQVPCRNCQFFSNNPYLKCTVHPSTALTSQANDCSDYLPQKEDG